MTQKVLEQQNKNGSNNSFSYIFNEIALKKTQIFRFRNFSEPCCSQGQTEAGGTPRDRTLRTNIRNKKQKN